MKNLKILLIVSISIYCCFCAFCQDYQISLKGTISAPVISRYPRDFSIYKDTVYILKGDGSVYLTDLYGNEITNPFSMLSLSIPDRIFVDKNYVFILTQRSVLVCTHKGQIVREISCSVDQTLQYFWVKTNGYIMVLSNQDIRVFDYNSGILLKCQPNTIMYANHFTNNGNAMYNFGRFLMKYEYSNGAIIRSNVTTTKYTQLYNQGYFISCFNGAMPCMFDYSQRDYLYILDPSFTSINSQFPLLSTFKPINDQQYIESGDPHLRIFYRDPNSYYIVNYSDEYVKIYLMSK